MMKKPDFLHVDTDPWKLKMDQKILGWAWSKMGLATLVSGLQNWLYLKKELLNKLIFGMLIKIQKSQKLL